MDPRRDLLELPRALRETLDKGGPEFDKLVRQTRWGDGPVYVIGSRTAYGGAMTAGLAIEVLVGLPAVVRAPAEFQTYALPAMRPRSILLALEPAGDCAETLEAVHAAKSRGARVLVLASDAQGELAKLADVLFMSHTGEARPGSRSAEVCRHVAACLLGLSVARALKRPSDSLRDIEEEFPKLPEHVEWAFSQLSDAVRALAAQLGVAPRVQTVGGGFYYPAAWHGAGTLRNLLGKDAQARNGMGTEVPDNEPPERRAALLLLSGSRCRGRKTIHALAESAKRSGTNLLAVTDKNDPEVSRRAALAILLPILSEEVGSLLTLALLDWVVCHGGPATPGGAERRRAEPRPRASR